MRNSAAIPGGSLGNVVKILVSVLTYFELKRHQETLLVLFGGFDLKAVHLYKTEIS